MTRLDLPFENNCKRLEDADAESLKVSGKYMDSGRHVQLTGERPEVAARNYADRLRSQRGVTGLVGVRI